MLITRVTSESVAAGHPDKIADRISDAILDDILRQDPHGRAGVETVVGANRVALFGEIHTTATIDYQKIVRDVLIELGYTNPQWGFSSQSPVEVFIHEQSPDIAVGVEDGGAGDQGMMYGYACDETEQLMPLPITLAHELSKKLDNVRNSGQLPFLRPDGKSQVTVRYEDGKPAGIDYVVMAVAHDENISETEVKEKIINKIITPILNEYGFEIPDGKQVIVNGTGVWHIPGPASDAGLTGRKIVVDTYGGYARVGGGAFSGKDPSKVDRSGAYAARWLAKQVVAAGYARQCEVGLAYVIGKATPLMKSVNTFGTESIALEEVEKFVEELLDCSVDGIINKFDLKRPIYQQTSAYGHFGKIDLPWEKI